MWGYMGESGPEHWPMMYEGCGGKSQSPIDIDTSNVKNIGSRNPLKFYNYKKPVLGEFVNNGHSMQFNPENPKQSLKSKFNIGKNKYQFLQLHFHWGSTDDQGSEHTIDGFRFPLEMHLVHINKKYTKNSTLAMEKPDGLAVIGIFFNIIEEDNPILDKVAFAADTLSLVNATTPIKSTLRLQDFFDEIPDSDFYSYQGSLTTPGCNQVVSWIVMEDTIPISLSQVRGLS